MVLYLAYRGGLRAGVVAAAAAVAYLLYFHSAFGPQVGPPDGDRWRLGVLILGVTASAAAVGHLRDRFDRLLEREREARVAAETARGRVHGILESISDGFVALDPDGRLMYLNQAAERLLGISRGELTGRRAAEVFAGPGWNAFAAPCRRAWADRAPARFEASAPDGTWLEVHAHPSADGLTVYFRDATERRRREERLRSMSILDELTGLYNRRGFFTLAAQQCKLAERKRRRLLLVFADLDDLKRINDTRGHMAGDQALCATAAVLRSTFRESDIVARIGGDEFAALALETEPEAGPILLDRLRAKLEEQNAREDFPFPLSLSIGTAPFEPESPCSVEELISAADAEMYREKRRKG